MDALRNTIALQQKATATWRKSLAIWQVRQRQLVRRLNCSGCHLARLEVDCCPASVVAEGLPSTAENGCNPKSKTMATKPNSTIATTTTTTTTTDQPSKKPIRDAVKRRPPTNNWLNASLTFVKLALLLGSL
ncbi:hypothetical protein BASA81_011983 [Batrachochytrium salamandrivorans]|nr:hypothetical protein BASA81_011983 [Batrachochytrium salamandrivorans]